MGHAIEVHEIWHPPMIANFTGVVAHDSPAVGATSNNTKILAGDLAARDRRPLRMVQASRPIPEVHEDTPQSLPVSGVATRVRAPRAARAGRGMGNRACASVLQRKPAGYSIGGPEIAGRLFMVQVRDEIRETGRQFKKLFGLGVWRGS